MVVFLKRPQPSGYASPQALMQQSLNRDTPFTGMEVAGFPPGSLARTLSVSSLKSSPVTALREL